MFKNLNREDLEVVWAIVKDIFKKEKLVDKMDNLLFNPGRERAQRNEFESMFGQDKDANGNMMFPLVSATGSTYVNLGRLIPVNDAEDTADLQDSEIFSGAYDDEVEDAEADFNNLELTTVVSPIPTTSIHKDYPKEQIIGDPLSSLQTRKMTKTFQEHAMIPAEERQCKMSYYSLDYRRFKDWLIYPEASMSLEQNRIEEIGLFLSYTSFMGFIMYQMDVKSAFLYGKIEEEVYVCQPPSFEDLHFPNKVYKVEKALYGLHQAPKALYETLSTCLLENRFRRGIIDKTLIIKKEKGNLLLMQVYVDDIIFGSTKKSLCIVFERLMHKKFQMSFIRELAFFLGLQAMHRDDGFFISQDKSIIGSLKYLTASRLDIMFAVCACPRFQVTPKVSHLHAVKRIFRYLKGQPKLGIWYPRDSPIDLEAFLDSDYDRASLDRKFKIGGCQFLEKRPISW
nr:hypothetical protein [Tanacetum cinerariifolium]